MWQKKQDKKMAKKAKEAAASKMAKEEAPNCMSRDHPKRALVRESFQNCHVQVEVYVPVYRYTILILDKNCSK